MGSGAGARGAASGRGPAASTGARGPGRALHEAWHRASVLGRADRSLTGRLALAAGVPATHALSALRSGRHRSAQDTWADPTTDYTLEPNPFRDSIRR